MFTVDDELYFLPECIPEFKSGTSENTTSARWRYRCVHEAWRPSAQASDGDIQQTLHHASYLLSQIHLCCYRVASLHPQAAAALIADARRAGQLSTQLQIQVLLAAGAMRWLWQHSSWQLLAQPRSHISCSCLAVADTMQRMLHEHLRKVGNLPASRSHALAIKCATDDLRLEKIRWMHLRACSIQWTAMPAGMVLLALTRLRNQYNAVRQADGATRSMDPTTTADSAQDGMRRATALNSGVTKHSPGVSLELALGPVQTHHLRRA